jgi:DNA polymerase-3 subunit gamma/tau
LRRIPVSLITEHLGYIAKKENVNIDAEALHAIARGADGGMRDAESALDQLISFCGDKIVESDVLSMFGLTARSQVVALAGAVMNGEAEVALRELNALAKHGKDLGRLVSDLLGHFRNLLIFQVSKGDLKLLEVSETEAASLKEQAALCDGETLTRLMEVLTDAEGRLRDAASKKIFIEVALLKAIEARKAISIDAVLKQLQQLRGESGGSATAARPAETPRSTPVATSNSKPTPSPAPPSAAAAVPANTQIITAGGTDLAPLWRGLLEAVGRASPFTRGYLVEAHPVSLEKNVFTIGFDPEFSDHIDLVNNQKTHAVLQTKLTELGHANTQIKFVKAEAPAGWLESIATAPNPSPAPPSSAATAPTPIAATPKKDKPQNVQLIRQALEIFKGRIVEVRA